MPSPSLPPPLPTKLAESIVKTHAAVLRRLVRWRYRALGLDIDRRVGIRKVEIPRNYWDISIGAHTAIDKGCVLLVTGPRRSESEGGKRIRIADRVYINRYTMIDASERIQIGARTMIGPHCYITDHDHGTRLGIPIPEQPLLGAPTVIQHDAWIGANVTILKNVTIGEGAIVAAGAVVTKSVEPNTIVAGIPAKPIAERK